MLHFLAITSCIFQQNLTLKNTVNSDDDNNDKNDDDDDQ